MKQNSRCAWRRPHSPCALPPCASRPEIYCKLDSYYSNYVMGKKSSPSVFGCRFFDDVCSCRSAVKHHAIYHRLLCVKVQQEHVFWNHFKFSLYHRHPLGDQEPHIPYIVWSLCCHRINCKQGLKKALLYIPGAILTKHLQAKSSS